MKTLLIIFFIPISCIGQSILTGNYCTPANLSGKCIQILEGNKFKYTDWGCFGSEAGEGDYAISKDTLKLVFSLAKDDTDELKIVSNPSHHSDSISISLLIKEVSGCRVSIGRYGEEQKIAEIRLSNTGTGHVSIPFDSTLHWLKVACLGTYNRKIHLTPNSDYSITGEINQFKTGQRNGGIEYYRIIKATRNSITLSIIDKSNKENPVIFDLTNE